MKSSRSQVIIFSKDRAMQLQGNLASLAAFCQEAPSLKVVVLYAASNEAYTNGYRKVKERFRDSLEIKWVREQEFRRDLLRLLGSSGCSNGIFSRIFKWGHLECEHDFTTLLVDDNLFVSGFSMKTVEQHLDEEPRSLGFSLRLGKNTTYCYSLNCDQKVPQFRKVHDGVLEFDWTTGEADFGYPLEVSSSTYRTRQLFRLLFWLPFSNPNTLEGSMAKVSRVYKKSRPLIHCFSQSVAFCSPVNKVQKIADNRSGNSVEYSTEYLNEIFLNGWQIDVEQLDGFTPNSCHEEIELPLRFIQ